MEVKVKLSYGLVKIQENGGNGIDTWLDVFVGIRAHEKFPAVDSSANYALALVKDVADDTRVDKITDRVNQVENELMVAMISLCHVWSFAGGGFLPYQKVAGQTEGCLTTNAQQVKESLLDQHGQREVFSSLKMSFSSDASWQSFPLKRAIEIMKLNRSDSLLRLMQQQFYAACEPVRDWYTWLYNVRDVIEHSCDNKGFKHAASTLGIDMAEHQPFKGKINGFTDRHGQPKEGVLRQLNPSERKKLFNVAHGWITRYIAYLEK